MNEKWCKLTLSALPYFDSISFSVLRLSRIHLHRPQITVECRRRMSPSRLPQPAHRSPLITPRLVATRRLNLVRQASSRPCAPSTVSVSVSSETLRLGLASSPNAVCKFLKPWFGGP
ncbi:hypothetical protein U1Q18_041377 [Sarracenia purpurea var. burkii]